MKFCFLVFFILSANAELWEKDLGKEVYIEASVEGLKEIHLQCTEDRMKVKIDLEEEGFDGVIYTRGSYQMGKRPCFYDAQGRRKEELSLEWSFNECKTENKTNVIIIQQDDLLIFPGDMAFELSCQLDKEDFLVGATIGLADPDPGAKRLPESKRKAVSDASGKVTFNPKAVKQSRDEL